jgi:glutathione S-transferase
MKLYGNDLSPFVQRVKIQAAVKGLTLPLEALPEGGLKGEAYLAINPIGKMPCLVTDSGLQLPESEVIMEYLEDAFPKPGLRPRKPEERAQARLLSRINDLYLMPAVGKTFPLLRGERSPEAVKAALEEVNVALGHLEAFLSGKKHAAGAKFTLADCTVPPTLFFIANLMPMLGVKAPFKGHPKIARYWKSRAKHPVTATAFGEMAAAMKKQLGL